MRITEIALFDKKFIEDFSEKYNLILSNDPQTDTLVIKNENINMIFDKKLYIIYFLVEKHSKTIPIADAYFKDVLTKAPQLGIKYWDNITQNEKSQVKELLKRVTEEIEPLQTAKIIEL